MREKQGKREQLPFGLFRNNIVRQNVERSLPDLMRCKAMPFASTQFGDKQVRGGPARITKLYKSHSSVNVKLPTIDADLCTKDPDAHPHVGNLNADLRLSSPLQMKQAAKLKKSQSYKLMGGISPVVSARW